MKAEMTKMIESEISGFEAQNAQRDSDRKAGIRVLSAHNWVIATPDGAMAVKIEGSTVSLHPVKPNFVGTMFFTPAAAQRLAEQLRTMNHPWGRLDIMNRDQLLVTRLQHLRDLRGALEALPA